MEGSVLSVEWLVQHIAMEFIFPILFPGDDLVGQNHRALPDARMVRKIVLLLKELTKPPEERKLDTYEPRVIQMLLQNGATRMAEDQEKTNKRKRKADENLKPADKGRQGSDKRQKKIHNCFKEIRAVPMENEEKGVDGDRRKDEREKPINEGDKNGKRGKQGEKKASKGGKGRGKVGKKEKKLEKDQLKISQFLKSSCKKEDL